MSDNDATRRRHRVADPLREFARETTDEPEIIEIYDDIANQIDREHERRMEQQSYDLRKAFCRYIGGVLDDYRHGMKRKRSRK